MCDDLRDYRFYGRDMVHPSDVAVDYIWEKFTQYSMDEGTCSLLPRLEKLSAAVNHRIMSPESPSNRAFIEKTLKDIDMLSEKLPTVDFTRELAYFTALKHNLQ